MKPPCSAMPFIAARHAVFANAVVDVASLERAGADRPKPGGDGQVGMGEIGRAADRQRRRGVDHAQHHLRRLAGRDLGGLADMFLAEVRQPAGQRGRQACPTASLRKPFGARTRQAAPPTCAGRQRRARATLPPCRPQRRQESRRADSSSRVPRAPPRFPCRRAARRASFLSPACWARPCRWSSCRRSAMASMSCARPRWPAPRQPRS